jgi:hypothetical protein
LRDKKAENCGSPKGRSALNDGIQKKMVVAGGIVSLVFSKDGLNEPVAGRSTALRVLRPYTVACLKIIPKFALRIQRKGRCSFAPHTTRIHHTSELFNKVKTPGA